jgi:hypothetical protein
MLNKYDKIYLQRGKGIPEERELSRPGFQGERHAIAIPSLVKYNFLGPGTRIDLRSERGDRGINDLDEAGRKHDLAYFNNAILFKKNKITKHDFLGNIKKSDSEFKEEARRSRDAPLMGKIASNLIGTKEIAESLFLPTSVFSGAGLKKIVKKEQSPLENLQKLVNNSKKNNNGQREIKMIDIIKNNNESQQGGIIPLVGIAVGAIISALSSKAIDMLVDHFKGQNGNGINYSDNLNKKEKIDYLMKFPINEITQQLSKFK